MDSLGNLTLFGRQFQVIARVNPSHNKDLAFQFDLARHL